MVYLKPATDMRITNKIGEYWRSWYGPFGSTRNIMIGVELADFVDLMVTAQLTAKGYNVQKVSAGASTDNSVRILHLTLLSAQCPSAGSLAELHKAPTPLD